MAVTPETPAIPPAEQTIGQLVANTLRFYAAHFWPSLALGFGPAVLAAVAAHIPRGPALAVAAGGGLLVFTASYVAASAMVVGQETSRRTLVDAFVAGAIVYLPAPVLFVAFLPGVVWFALIGLAVPAAVAESLGVGNALGRGFALGRADFVHALGTVGTLGLLVFLTGQAMGLAIYGVSGHALDAAAFLSTLVLTPVLFLGAAHLYEHQAARAAVHERAAVKSSST
jgi:hypothetical protein